MPIAIIESINILRRSLLRLRAVGVEPREGETLGMLDIVVSFAARDLEYMFCRS